MSAAKMYARLRDLAASVLQGISDVLPYMTYQK